MVVFIHLSDHPERAGALFVPAGTKIVSGNKNPGLRQEAEPIVIEAPSHSARKRLRMDLALTRLRHSMGIALATRALAGEEPRLFGKLQSQ